MYKRKVFALFLVLATQPASVAVAQVFPGATWEVRTPAEVGLSREKLDQLKKKSGNASGVIIKDGYLVYSWGDVSRKFDWGSAWKPVLSTMLFFAINEGRVAGVDQLVGPTGGWPLKQKDQAMTFRHLANMVSGYALPEEPGVAWAYNDYGIELYSKTVFDIVFDEGSADIAARHPERLGALEFEDGGILGPGRGGFALQTSLRDFARIGLFWLNRGNWNGTQILPEGYFDFFTPQVPADLPRTAAVKVNDYLGVGSSGGGANQTPLGPGIYGFNLWHNPDRTTWPNAPPDAYQANGHWNGEVLTVIPTLGIVAAWKGKRAEASSFTGAMDRLLKLLVEAAE